MKNIKLLFITIIVATGLSSCDSEYKVVVSPHSINITIPARTVGVAGLNEVSYGGVDLRELDNEIYELFCGFKSAWGLCMNSRMSVHLYYSKTDKYGRKIIGYVGNIGEINKSEVKKYNVGYFHEISKMIYEAQTIYPTSYQISDKASNIILSIRTHLCKFVVFYIIIMIIITIRELYIY